MLNRNGDERMKKRIRVLAAAAVLLFSCATADTAPPSVMSCSIYKTVWRWGAGQTAEFEGNIICDNVNSEQPLSVRLSVDVLPEKTEVKDPVFREVDGKPKGNRHPPKEISIDTSDHAIRFSGGWEIPGDSRIDEAVIHLKIYNKNDGELLGEAELRMRNDQITTGETGIRIPETGNKIWYLAAAAAVIWILAAIRIYLNRRER